MVRVLRYKGLTVSACVGAVACALARDYLLAQQMIGWARVLLAVTLLLLLLCVALLSCRFFVDADGVGVGFLLRVRRTPWQDLRALGVLRCNSSRRYLYGMYGGASDFLNLLHHAPRCGDWGFVVPLTDRLEAAIEMNCPYKVCTSGAGMPARTMRQRPLWQQAAVQLLVMVPPALAAFGMAMLMALRAASVHDAFAAWGWTAAAMLLCCAGSMLMARVRTAATTCPCISEEGVSAGRGLYLPWSEVRFCYGRRTVEGSGLFLLSQPLEAANRHGCPPVLCLSLPDTSTLLLAYLTYCPYAKKAL
ncbi:MAG: hypothetical protein J6K32_05955 [Clostridia bacterium]|nr:hypothetical protein [Clostridia bacterium]